MQNWIITANGDIYDHKTAFARWGYIDWQTRVNYEVGDIVYIYVKPERVIRYKTIVEKINISFDSATEDKELWSDSSHRKTSGKFTRLRLVSKMNYDKELSFSELKKHGLLNAPQDAYKLKAETLNYIETIVGKDNEIDRLKDERNRIEETIINLGIVGEEKKAIIKVRINQSVFRDLLLKKYSRCCLCGVSDKTFLRASHIKPWAVSEPDEKIDVENGLLLCPNHDILFDKGYITFNDDGSIVISDLLKDSDKIFLNIRNDMKINLTSDNMIYMKYHRHYIFRSRCDK